ncbi:MAG: TolC family protein, partial [Bacteroidetes bacterium]|nr:TolC family protein [Bacteroidota bacterium]
MRKRGTILLIVLCLGAISMAQNPIKDLTREILSNNLVLQALEIENQVKLLQDKGELYPDDPEISYAHLWGSPAI